MPNAQWNAFRELGQFMGMSDKIVAQNSQDAKSTEVMRCPSDEFLPQDQIFNALSYAPVVDSGYCGSAVGAPPLYVGNATNCAWSYCRTGYQSGTPSVAGNKIWQMRNLAQIAPDTFILCEYWSPANRLMLTQETPAGYLLYAWNSPLPASPKDVDPTHDITKMGQGGTIKFGGQSGGILTSYRLDRCAPLINSIGNPYVAPAIPPAVPTANDNTGGVGGYIMLSAFGNQAAQTAKKIDIASMLHDGYMNLLVSDGSVISKDVKSITDKAPCYIPGWTRVAD
jgi:hypothetical protein